MARVLRMRRWAGLALTVASTGCMAHHATQAGAQRLQSVVRMHAERMSQTHACGMGQPGGR